VVVDEEQASEVGALPHAGQAEPVPAAAFVGGQPDAIVTHGQVQPAAVATQLDVHALGLGVLAAAARPGHVACP
jgi:hypothetical protein